MREFNTETNKTENLLNISGDAFVRSLATLASTEVFFLRFQPFPCEKCVFDPMIKEMLCSNLFANFFWKTKWSTLCSVLNWLWEDEENNHLIGLHRYEFNCFWDNSEQELTSNMSDSEADETEITTEEWTRTISVMKKKKMVMPSKRKSSGGDDKVQQIVLFN